MTIIHVQRRTGSTIQLPREKRATRGSHHPVRGPAPPRTHRSAQRAPSAAPSPPDRRALLVVCIPKVDFKCILLELIEVEEIAVAPLLTLPVAIRLQEDLAEVAGDERASWDALQATHAPALTGLRAAEHLSRMYVQRVCVGAGVVVEGCRV